MTANARAKIALQIKMYTYDVLPVPLATRLYRYCLEFRALRLGSLLGLGLPVTAKARSRAIYIIAVLPIIEYRI